MQVPASGCTGPLPRPLCSRNAVPQARITANNSQRGTATTQKEAPSKRRRTPTSRSDPWCSPMSHSPLGILGLENRRSASKTEGRRSPGVPSVAQCRRCPSARCGRRTSSTSRTCSASAQPSGAVRAQSCSLHRAMRTLPPLDFRPVRPSCRTSPIGPQTPCTPAHSNTHWLEVCD